TVRSAVPAPSSPPAGQQVAAAPAPPPPAAPPAAAQRPAPPVGLQASNAPAAGAGDYIVQVTSQRSESQAAAAYRDLQRRFPTILGSLQPDIQKADLGAKGIYYRVRVAPASREVAASFCEQLKSAGGDCVVSR